MKNGINVLSLFDGKSGGLQALKESGVQVNKYYASEIKEDGIKVALDNHSEIIQIGDVTKVKFLNGVLYTENNEYNVGKIDLLIGGSPCQDFSQANIRRDGLNGAKSGLFFEWLRLREEINPTYWFLENVRMKPEHLELVNNFVGMKPVVINSKLVSAQNRERYYWTNINNGEILQPKDMKIKLNDILTDGYCPLEKSRCLMEGDSRPTVTPVKMYHRFHKFTTLIFRNKQHYNDCKTHYNLNFTKLIDGKKVNYSAIEIDEKIKTENIDLSVYDGVRYPNQIELERLQTLPEGYTKTLNRNDAAGVIGDGWTIKVISHIFNHLPKEWRND